MTSAMKFAPKFGSALRAAALCTAVALLPATTAGFAQVESRASPEFARLFATYQRIKASYVEEVDDEVLIRGAIDGMLAALDPHSAYLDGPSLARLETMIDGNYQGLGISIQMDDGAVKVVSPFRGSPADEAGIKAGDYITHIDGRLIYGLDINEAVAQMRGPAGTSINLTLFRPGRDEPVEVTVTRGVIELEPVTFELMEGQIGHISVNEFSRDVGSDVLAAVSDLRRQANGQLAGIVLDLRRNPGGSLDEAVALSDLFLDSGQIVSQRGRRATDTIYYDAETVYRGDVAQGLPVIVLIDEGSASASEIVAGALQDHNRALIMGETSFGKGSVQTLLPLTRDSALKLTTARYYTPSGRSVQEGGIEPDIRVPQLSDPDAERRQRYALRESDLRGHLINEIARDDEGLERDRAADPRFLLTAAQLEEQGIEDFQLHYALESLRRTTRTTLAARAPAARRN
jgi:carboxyl-terminal processing protease